jgi:hypothetical protein
LLQLDLGEVRFIVSPARSKLADVFCPGIDSLFDEFADVNPSVLVFSSRVVKQILGDQILLETFLNNLTLEEKPLGIFDAALGSQLPIAGGLESKT